MRYIEFLLEDYKSAKAKFINSGTTTAEITNIFTQFKQIQNRLTGDEKNIDWWAKNKTFADLEKFVNSKISTPTKSSLKKTIGDQLALHDPSCGIRIGM